MKKILLTILCLAVAFGASAKFRVGPTVGANFSTLNWKQKLFPSTMLPGYNAGVQCEVMIPGIGFGVDFGLKYVNQGGKCNFGDQFIWSSDGIGNTDLRLHTIQLPFDVRFKWTKMDGFENYLAPYVFAGPQFNFNVASTKCEAVDKIGVSVGLQVGLGVELYKRFQLSGGYVWGMSDAFRTKKLDDFNCHLNGWLVDFAVLF